MKEEGTLNILKQAILLEKRGKSFYSTAAQNSGNEAVKRFFELMAAEEDQHVEVLSKQYRQFQKEKTFISDELHHDFNSDVASEVLTEQVRQRISAAGFEAAAISAAMAMEERAIKLYSSGAEKADSPVEKALFKWLAEWEREHLRVLSAVDRELSEKVWYDNQFWPF